MYYSDTFWRLSILMVVPLIFARIDKPMNGKPNPLVNDLIKTSPKSPVVAEPKVATTAKVEAAGKEEVQPSDEYQYQYTYETSVEKDEPKKVQPETEYHYPYYPKFKAHPRLGLCQLSDF